MRRAHFAWITPTHTLIHLDGIALGSLLALGLYTLALSRRTWLVIGMAGFVSASRQRRRSRAARRFSIRRWPLGFAGAVLAAIASTGARNPLNAALRRGPLAFYGRISYGLYMIHIMVFIYFGWFDLKMDPTASAGNLAIVAFRWPHPLPAPPCSGTALNRRF